MASREKAEIVGGEDSLLDVIANLVGVLIILVAIASVCSRRNLMLEAESTEQNSRLQAARDERDTAVARAGQVGAAFHESERELKALRHADQNLQMLRHQALIERELELRRLKESGPGDAGSREPALAETRLAVSRLQNELSSVSQQIAARKNSTAVRREIKHYPTPIAKTVFSDEVHFRLIDGRIEFVPINELVEQMKAQWKSRPAAIRPGEEILEEVGPLDGFRMQYRLSATAERAAGGESQRVFVELQQFSMLAERTDSGETVADAVREGSRFATRLSRLRPEKTTVSVWVYPDCFQEYSQLRDWLRQKGFQTAAWPIEHGQQISGGPNGMRTTAQ